MIKSIQINRISKSKKVIFIQLSGIIAHYIGINCKIIKTLVYRFRLTFFGEKITTEAENITFVY